MTKGMCSSWISIFGFEDQKHRAKYSLNALRARSTRRARSSSSFSLSLMAVAYTFGRIAARDRFAARRLRPADACRAGGCDGNHFSLRPVHGRPSGLLLVHQPVDPTPARSLRPLKSCGALCKVRPITLNAEANRTAADSNGAVTFRELRTRAKTTSDEEACSALPRPSPIEWKRENRSPSVGLSNRFGSSERRVWLFPLPSD